MPRHREDRPWQPLSSDRLGEPPCDIFYFFTRFAKLEPTATSKHGAAWPASEPTMLTLAQLASSLLCIGASCDEEMRIIVILFSWNPCHWLHRRQLRSRTVVKRARGTSLADVNTLLSLASPLAAAVIVGHRWKWHSYAHQLSIRVTSWMGWSFHLFCRTG